VRLRALDARDRLSGRSGRLVPPRRLVAVHPGLWTGRADGLSFQDVVVARA
jgi:hypothetical protein